MCRTALTLLLIFAMTSLAAPVSSGCTPAPNALGVVGTYTMRIRARDNLTWRGLVGEWERRWPHRTLVAADLSQPSRTALPRHPPGAG